MLHRVVDGVLRTIRRLGGAWGRKNWEVALISARHRTGRGLNLPSFALLMALPAAACFGAGGTASAPIAQVVNNSGGNLYQVNIGNVTFTENLGTFGTCLIYYGGGCSTAFSTVAEGTNSIVVYQTATFSGASVGSLGPFSIGNSYAVNIRNVGGYCAELWQRLDSSGVFNSDTTRVLVGTTCGGSSSSLTLSVSNGGAGYGSVASSPSGISCYTPVPGNAYLVAPDCAENYVSGTKVALTATPASGSVFAGWSGACTGTGTCSVTMDTAKSVAATFSLVRFSTALTAIDYCVFGGGICFSPPAPVPAKLSTTITFNAPDVGKPGAVFVTAWVPVNALGTLGISAALNAQLSVTGTRDNPHLAGATNTVHVNHGPLVEMDSTGFVLVQLTSSGWQLVVNGQLIPYASGVLGEQLAAQTILQKDIDTTNLKGAQFCLGYGTSAEDMIAAGRIQVVAVIPDPNAASAATGSCLLTTMPVYRFFNNNAGGHFYTINEPEKDTVIQDYNWFRYEGIGFHASPLAQPGMLPVYRFFNNNAGGHFYTINEAEKDTVIRDYNWFRYEGIGFYASTVAQPGTLPLYRFFNNNAGGHFYTITEAEKDTVIQNYNWFRYEGIGFYAYPPQ
jgi:hypothetical protein